jgi:predicted Zn-dependent protease
MRDTSREVFIWLRLIRAAEYDPESVLVNLTLAQALMQQNRFKEAEAYHLAVLHLRKDDRTARQGLAEVHRRLGIPSAHPH